MFSFFRRTSPPYQTPLAMIGARVGDRVLFFGSRDPALVAELALVTGLNGQTSVLATPEGKTVIDAAAAKAGSLVDFIPDPPGLRQDDGRFDVAVWEADLRTVADEHRRIRMAEMLRAVRPGGRAIILDGAGGRKTFGGSAPAVPSEAVIALLVANGARAARTLAVADGVTYYEARRPGSPP